ncbi:class I SAM-dependent methyltransferase [Streptomyces sp.]|uniref:class I SAM-dependent methyltransferase n=1 Tax=Streptomyces sp. TaxID=1931 RepID=UPI002D3E977A|nr:methyltransferase domain-containing protein [Streptomyces sp.]HZF89911.1 methyltransferase domain-containing protein [Streptomyces sp.]
MLTSDHGAWGFTSSTGLGFTHHTIVDAHFHACADTYGHLLGQAGIQPGWRVLDAGCGSGDFLPWLAALVGPQGQVDALDLAEENAALARRRTDALDLACGIDVRQGSVLALPYADDSFDAVWCSNTVQYLDDGELAGALSEMCRVVRPGGVVAVKELDPHLITARPVDPFLFHDFFRAAGATPGYARQLMRSRDLYRWLKRAGLAGVRQQTVLIEHFAPLTEAARDFYGSACAQLATQARDLGLSDEWELFLDPEAGRNPLDHPDGYISEGGVLAVGTVPPGARELR